MPPFFGVVTTGVTRFAAFVRVMSSSTAPITTAPVRKVCQGAWRPHEDRPFLSTDIMNTPMSVPIIEPEPPAMEVPPIITPVMPLSS